MQHSDNGKVDRPSFLGIGSGLHRRFDTCLERTVLRADPRRTRSDRPGPQSPPNLLTKAPTLRLRTFGAFTLATPRQEGPFRIQGEIQAAHVEHGRALHLVIRGP